MLPRWRPTWRAVGEQPLRALGCAYFRLSWSVTVAVWLRLPLVPVIVSVTIPGLLLLLVWIVRVDVAEVLGGLNVAVAPGGRPLTLKATVPVKPPLGVTATV